MQTWRHEKVQHFKAIALVSGRVAVRTPVNSSGILPQVPISTRPSGLRFAMKTQHFMILLRTSLFNNIVFHLTQVHVLYTIALEECTKIRMDSSPEK